MNTRGGCDFVYMEVMGGPVPSRFSIIPGFENYSVTIHGRVRNNNTGKLIGRSRASTVALRRNCRSYYKKINDLWEDAFGFKKLFITG
jgi:hypothetical protein